MPSRRPALSTASASPPGDSSVPPRTEEAAAHQGRLRLRDWSGLSCWPIFIHDRAHHVGGMRWEGVGASHTAAWLVRAGSVTVATGGHEATARVGDWMVPSRSRHRNSFSADAAILSVRLHALWPDGRPLIDPRLAFVLPRDATQELSSLAKRLERFATRNFTQADTGMEWKRADAVQYLDLNRHFFAWLTEFVARLAEAGCPPTTPARADERALRAAQLLNTMPLHEAWDLAGLAARVGLSPAHLNRLFVEAFDTTPRQYYQQRRKRAALHLLREEALPIKQAAATLGFSSACYFTAWFRAQFGTPPAQWRRRPARGEA
ncbi:AraC family transcriptional regulator [Verrucomicrobia bacterium LW23]|nr:AraC family transcriptional regulator [Verrucomicrobia bacterium LW23]